jgi:hypothetical protein
MLFIVSNGTSYHKFFYLHKGYIAQGVAGTAQLREQNIYSRKVSERINACHDYHIPLRWIRIK